ncbi:hypothetical protein ACFLX8_03535 [Chloroflexota bacterium]
MRSCDQPKFSATIITLNKTNIVALRWEKNSISTATKETITAIDMK